MDSYTVSYRLKGVGITLQEQVSARSDFEARKIIESRYPAEKNLYIVQAVKQQPQGGRG